MDGAGYKYDILILYSSSKSELARKVLEDLESKFHIKCCIDDRDYIPGAEIWENMRIFMGSSKKVVLLICREFIASRWCQYEQNQAFSKHIGENNCIIPVLLEDIEVPWFLRNVTHLKYYDEADPVKRIHQAFKYKADFLSEGQRTSTTLGNQRYGIDFDESLSSQYQDDFADKNERLEFIKEETDLGIIQEYFDKASKAGDLNLIRCILENDYTRLSSNNINNFCAHIAKEAVNPELVEMVFKKRQHGLSLTEYKNSYFYACARDIPCLTARFNKLGCESLIDVSFVKKLIPSGRIQDTCNTLMSILKNRKWSNDELSSLLDVAIQSKHQEVAKVLLALIPMIPIEQYLNMIQMIDENTCLEVLRKGYIQGQKNLYSALQSAIVWVKKDLAKEIVKRGVTLEPSFIDDTLSFEMMQVFIEEYPWSLEELQEMKMRINATQVQETSAQ